MNNGIIHTPSNGESGVSGLKGVLDAMLRCGVAWVAHVWQPQGARSSRSFRSSCASRISAAAIKNLLRKLGNGSEAKTIFTGYYWSANTEDAPQLQYCMGYTIVDHSN